MHIRCELFNTSTAQNETQKKKKFVSSSNIDSTRLYYVTGVKTKYM